MAKLLNIFNITKYFYAKKQINLSKSTKYRKIAQNIASFNQSNRHKHNTTQKLCPVAQKLKSRKNLVFVYELVNFATINNQ